MVDELEATAPFIDQRYADPVALAVRAALTDAELFISYNMPAKALGPLMSALPQAPRDLRINQRLAALHTRAQRFTEAAVCCRTLESIYHEAGCPDEATRYGELSAKYEERAASAPVLSSRAAARVESAAVVEEAQVGEIAVAAEPPAPVAPAEAAAEAGPFFHAAEAQPGQTEFAVQAAPTQEIDLSSEWEEGFSEAPAAGSKKSKAAAGASEATIAEAVEEIRFYLANGMAEEAQAGLRKLEQLNPDAAKLDALRAEIEAARKHAPAAEAVSVEVTENSVQVDEEPAAPAQAPAALDAFVSDLESSLGDGFLPQATPQEFAVKPEAEPVVPAAAEAQPAPALNALVSDLESSLGDSFLAAAPVAQTALPPAQTVPAPAPPAVPAAMAAAAAAAPAASPTFSYQPTPIRPLVPQVPGAVPPAKSDAGAGVDLADMFGELKHELEEDTTSAEEDPETHYNLGVAFREMGLLDEAIGELQKVCQSVEHGHPFTQIMQTYTWLAQCFLDKGVPEAAIRWYEKALTLPTLDADTRTALHYELASSYEVAGNKTAALSHFMEVYGSNIDYRDVAERIKTLKS